MKETRSLPAELFAGRTLIFQLAKNDFKKKYAGSYLGIVWAFVQPVVTVMVYWFVFGMIRSSSPRPVPFVLWLIAGLIPWFFFQDGLINGTNALLEYNYLVKKVVFRIDILPMVKVVSAVFVHLFFILVALILYTAMGCYPTVYTIQVIYYTFCIFVLVLGITYMTSSVVVFFRDTGDQHCTSGGSLDDSNHVVDGGSRHYRHPCVHLEIKSDVLYCPGIS